MNTLFFLLERSLVPSAGLSGREFRNRGDVSALYIRDGAGHQRGRQVARRGNQAFDLPASSSHPGFSARNRKAFVAAGGRTVFLPARRPNC